MKDLFSMQGKVAVITGGAGYLGAAMTEGLLEFGATVIVVSTIERNPDEIINNSKKYENLFSLVCDVTNAVRVKEMFSRCKGMCGKIDVLINCAAFGAGFGAQGTVDKMTDEDFEKGIDGSLGITFKCTREVIPYMEENGGGAIVNISSMYGVVSPDPRIYGSSGQNSPANYGAGKAAVLQFTRYCAAHLASRNIRVNSVTPGPFPDCKKAPPEEFMNNLKNKTMLNKVGKPKDIVGAVLLLASDASSFMTGSNIVVDGGWTAW